METADNIEAHHCVTLPPRDSFLLLSSVVTQPDAFSLQYSESNDIFYFKNFDTNPDPISLQNRDTNPDTFSLQHHDTFSLPINDSSCSAQQQEISDSQIFSQLQPLLVNCSSPSSTPSSSLLTCNYSSSSCLSSVRTSSGEGSNPSHPDTVSTSKSWQNIEQVRLGRNGEGAGLKRRVRRDIEGAGLQGVGRDVGAVGLKGGVVQDGEGVGLKEDEVRDDLQEKCARKQSHGGDSRICGDVEEEESEEGTGEGGREVIESRGRRALLLLVDNIICGLVIGPLNVLYWRGVWDLLGRHFFAHSQLTNDVACLLLGNLGIMVSSFAQTELMSRVTSHGLVDFGIIRHIYTYLLGLFNIAQWRAVWSLLDVYTGVDTRSAWVTFFVGYVLLCCLRCLNCAHAPPMSVSVDTDHLFFQHTTRFRTKAGWSVAYILDTFFTVVVVHQLVAVYWRGAWALFDCYLYPNDSDQSALASILISYVLQIMVCALEPVFNNAYQKQSPACGVTQRTLLEQFMFTLATVLEVAHWRGVWMLAETYMLPERPDLSCIISHIFGLSVLMLMLCGHSVTMKGCDLDGSSLPENGCVCPNKYIRYYYERHHRRSHSTTHTSHTGGARVEGEGKGGELGREAAGGVEEGREDVGMGEGGREVVWKEEAGGEEMPKGHIPGGQTTDTDDQYMTNCPVTTGLITRIASIDDTMQVMTSFKHSDTMESCSSSHMTHVKDSALPGHCVVMNSRRVDDLTSRSISDSCDINCCCFESVILSESDRIREYLQKFHSQNRNDNRSRSVQADGNEASLLAPNRKAAELMTANGNEVEYSATNQKGHRSEFMDTSQKTANNNEDDAMAINRHDDVMSINRNDEDIGINTGADITDNSVLKLMPDNKNCRHSDYHQTPFYYYQSAVDNSRVTSL